MIIGHYASALIPHSRDRAAPFALYLFVAMMQDPLWLSFALLGIEPTFPESILEASFSKLHVEMTYSHDLVPALGWALAAGALGWLVTRKRRTAGWCAMLAAGHELLDLLSGFRHHLAGPATAAVGLNLYGSAPYLALLIEAAFGAAAVFVYTRSEAGQGRELPAKRKLALYGLFVFGALACLPGAEKSASDWLQQGR